MSILRTSNSTWAYDFWQLGKRYRKRFKSREQAIKFEATKRLELGRGSGKGSEITFKEAVHLFIENHSKPNKSEQSWKIDLSKAEYLCRLFGKKRLIDFTPLDIQHMRSHLVGKGLTNSTADRYHSLVKAMFNKMIIWQRFEGFNPANGVKLKREPNAHIRFLNKAEIQSLEANLTNTSLYPYFVGALHTGMRLRELCGVKWKDVTLPLRDIFIPKSKSGKSRHIPVSNVLYDLLLRLYGEGKPDDELVFGILHPCHVSHKFMAKFRELGIKDFRFHDFRHTFASQLVMASVDVFQVCKWLGHSSVMITEKYYAHLSPDSKREEINSLNKLSAFYEKRSEQTNFRQTSENVKIPVELKAIENRMN